MDVVKYKVEKRLRGTEFIVSSDYYNTEMEAKNYTEYYNENFKLGDIIAEYKGGCVIKVTCDSCDRDIVEGDKYIKVDDYNRYCEDCYTENISIDYYVDGEYVGNDYDVVEIESFNECVNNP